MWQVAIVAGAGGGIGFEAARALLWLGASVIVAEIDEADGEAEVERLQEELPTRGSSSWRPTSVTGNPRRVLP